MGPSTEGVDEESNFLARCGRPMNGGSVFRADFQQVRRGYAPDEVTAHLRLVAEHMADLEARIQELDAQLAERQQSAGADAGDPYDVVAARIADLVRSFDEDVARMRLDAETEVDRILQEAREQAERTRQEAQAEVDRLQQEADTVRQQAEADAARIISEVTERSQRLIADAQREAEESVAGLRSRRDALLEDLGQINQWLDETSARLGAILERATPQDSVVVEPGTAE
jgi:cell division septum initiation protein DivIVA